MKPTLMLAMAIVAATAIAPAQELLWQLQSTRDNWWLDPGFGDLDHDGCDDVLLYYNQDPYVIDPTVPSGDRLRILSGVNGAVLDDRLSPSTAMLAFRSVGDFDLDGYPDYAVSYHFNTGIFYVQVWSPHLHQQLLLITSSPLTPFYSIADKLCGRVDLDGDGLPDLVLLRTAASTSELRAYSHSGALLYLKQLAPLLARAWDVQAMPDLDGDGANELLLATGEYSLGYARGLATTMSGRTGSVLRLNWEQVQGDRMVEPVAVVGDIDRDGVVDYAAGNPWGINARQLINVYSGATGAMVRQWVYGPAYNLANELLGRRDVDLDGVPDIVAASTGYPVAIDRSGSVQIFSTRDQQRLLQWIPTYPVDLGVYANLGDLGVQPGSPYPVLAISCFTNRGPYTGVLEVWRCSPPGTRLVGAGCTSGTLTPTANIRRTDTPAGERARLILGHAPPGALALCVAADASETSVSGNPLPFGLDYLGFPGCNLLVPPTVSQVTFAGSTYLDYGYTAIDVPFRLDPGGHAAAFQWLVLDPVTGAYGATQRCETHVR